MIEDDRLRKSEVSKSVGKSISASQSLNKDGFTGHAHEDAGASAVADAHDSDAQSAQSAAESAHAGLHASATGSVHGSQHIIKGVSATESGHAKASVHADVHEDSGASATEKSGQLSANLKGSIGASAEVYLFGL